MSDDSNLVLNVLVVEDGFSFALELRMLLEKIGYCCAGIVDNAGKALSLIENDEPDAILMDIDLKGKVSGLDLAEKIKDREIPILFITSYKDDTTYSRAAELNHIGFLVKPLNDFTLLSAIDACLRAIEPRDVNSNVRVINHALLIKKGKIYYKIKLDEVSFISSEKEYITLHTPFNKFVLRDSLKSIMLELPEGLFVKCHQSYVVNLEQLVSIDIENSKATMHSGIEVPISRRNKKQLFERFKLMQ